MYYGEMPKHEGVVRMGMTGVEFGLAYVPYVGPLLSIGLTAYDIGGGFDDNLYSYQNRYYLEEDITKIFDSISYLENIVSKANNNILLIDPYVYSKALNVLKNTKNHINIRIIKSNKSKLSNIDINNFIKQYNININISIDNNFHDRYLFIDGKVFHLGSSINYLGNKISQITEIEDDDIKDYLKKRVNY